MPRYLVVGHQTAGTPALVRALQSIQRREKDAEFVLLVPATPVVNLTSWERGEATEIARRRARIAAGVLREAEITLVEARVGNASPVTAVEDELRRSPGYAGVVIATLPPGVSRWMRRDVVSRLRGRVSIPVTHVIAHVEDSRQAV